MNIDECVSQLADISKKVYISAFKENDELNPTVFLLNEKFEPIQMFQVVGNAPGNMYEIVQKIVRKSGLEPYAIGLCSDSYILKMNEEDITPEILQEVRNPTKSLGQRFKDGDPNVKEAIHAFVMTKDQQRTVTIAHRYSSVDGLEFDEPEMMGVGEDTTAQSDWNYNDLVYGLPRTMLEYPICPICKGFIPNNSQPGLYPGALSRVDNKTEICSDCGMQEALMGIQRPPFTHESDTIN